MCVACETFAYLFWIVFCSDAGFYGLVAGVISTPYRHWETIGSLLSVLFINVSCCRILRAKINILAGVQPIFSKHFMHNLTTFWWQNLKAFDCTRNARVYIIISMFKFRFQLGENVHQWLLFISPEFYQNYGLSFQKHNGNGSHPSHHCASSFAHLFLWFSKDELCFCRYCIVLILTGITKSKSSSLLKSSNASCFYMIWVKRDVHSSWVSKKNEKDRIKNGKASCFGYHLISF